MPDRVRAKLKSESDYQNCTPQLLESDVIKQIRSSKKTNSLVPGDLPKPLIQEYPEELAKPVTKVFQTMLASKKWPNSWRTEYGVPLQKVQNPESESQLRIISLTSFFSKVFENFVIKWLLGYIGDKIDPKQFGGQKGNSITHYLIEFINFILYNQDMTNPHAVLTLLVDYSQAFNRSNHFTIITILSDMGVPKWLLELVISFLKEREMIVRQKGKHSSKKSLPGGTPQGTRLGMFLFLVLINFAGFAPNTRAKNIGNEVTKSRKERKPIVSTHMKYIDDLSLAASLDLKENLVKSTDQDIQRPLSYHERTLHTLPEDKNIIQQEFNTLQAISRDQGMVINKSKTKVMLFNSGKKYDFLPKIRQMMGQH